MPLIRTIRTTLQALLLAAMLAFGGLAQAAALTDYAENKSLDALIRGQSLGAPATWYLALYTDTCSDAGSGTEVSTSGTGYGRQAVTASLANWAGSQSAGSTSASSGTGGTTSNNGTIAWSTSTASWGNVQSAGWTDASTAGNRWICINLTAALNVTGAGFTVSFPAAALTFQIDN
ncbi:hypothetical protein [Accumulibacter sp.]|uniref:phage tail fiber protein n=1 Tax=Accumulibacter sp. TaxID=2053492 RepID=UPI002611A589|nr:hypothetical protein [Accumulibacter sp.]